MSGLCTCTYIHRARAAQAFLATEMKLRLEIDKLTAVQRSTEDRAAAAVKTHESEVAALKRTINELQRTLQQVRPVSPPFGNFPLKLRQFESNFEPPTPLTHCAV